MQEINFDIGVETILAKDSRYAREAYAFVREGLDFTQRLVVRDSQKAVRQHVTGQELLDGLRQYALQQFGPMAITVFEEWGIRRCADFGDMVFNMIDAGLLAKTEKDNREDFQEGYPFEEAFRKPFLPEGKLAKKAKSTTKSD